MPANLPLVLTAVVALFGVFILALAYGAWATHKLDPAATRLTPAE